MAKQVKAKNISGKNKTKVFWITGVILAAVLLVGLVGFFVLQATEGNKIGTVNGLPVYAAELAMYADERRAAVGAEIAGENGLSSYGESFWDTEFDGVTPRGVLYQRSLEALVRDKVIQHEAIQHGITAPGDYDEVLKALEDRNEKTGEMDIYGPDEYRPNEYHGYLMTDTTDALKAYLLENDLAPTEEQLREAFYTLPDDQRKTDYYLEGWRIWVPEDVDTGDAFRQLTGAFSDLGAGQAAIDQAASEISGLVGEEFELQSASVHREDTALLVLVQELYDVQEGEWFVASSRYLYYVASKEGGELLEYEEAPGFGKNKYINDAFESFIDERVSAAQVEMHPDAIKAIG